MTLAALWATLTAPTSALPLDLFRVLVALLSLVYFARTYHEALEISGPQGLFDHAWVRRALPFTRLSLFPPNISLIWLRGLFLSGCGAAGLLALGIGTPWVAGFLYLLAVSTYRWNFLVMYVDDAIMHLALFWLVVLPVGHTLTLPGLLAGEATSWLTATVPGLAARCLLFNFALIYLVAGVWKWASPMWRNGTALAATLQLAVAYTPHIWRAPHFFWLKLSNYYALGLEPLLALLLFAPAHTPLKWALWAGAVSFHLGIIVTMRVPFANLAMLAGGVVWFGPELMQALGAPPLAFAAQPLMLGDGVALGVVVCLAGLFLLDAGCFRGGYSPALWQKLMPRFSRLNPLYVPLWLLGLAQSYRLFDWIDDRNYHAHYEVLERCPNAPPRVLDPTTFFPNTVRHVLLQTYLHGNIWIKLDPEQLPEWRALLLTNYARRYCRRYPTATTIEVYATVQRLTPDNLERCRGTRVCLLRFTNHGGEPVITEMCLNPPAYF